MSVTPIRTPAEKALGEAMAALPAIREPRLAALRGTAAERFAEAGLPHRRVEEYKWTDLRALLRVAAPLAPPPSAEAARAAAARTVLGLKTRRLVVVDGDFRPELSDPLPAGVTLVPMAKLLAEGGPLAARVGRIAPPKADPVLALSEAMLWNGLALEVAPGAAVDGLVEIAHVVAAPQPVAVHLRHLVVVGEGASIRLIESFTGPHGSAYQVTATTEVAIAAGARATLVKAQAEGTAALHLGTLLVDLGEGAELSHFLLGAGAGVARSQIFATLSGENATLSTRGVGLLDHDRHADVTLVVDHAVPNGTSRELYKSAVDDRAKVVFQGKIIVRPHAQKTDGKMSSNVVLLSDEAEVAHKPELEIFADDVVCGHGATAGALDDKLKFYLKSRGIPDAEAEKLLVLAFLAEAIEEMDDAEIGEALTARVEAWLEARAARA